MGGFRSMRALAAATGSLETGYRVQKCAGEWSVGVQRGGDEHLGWVLCLVRLAGYFELYFKSAAGSKCNCPSVSCFVLKHNTQRYWEIYSALLPICTVAKAVKAICKHCGSVLDVTILLILLSLITVQAAVCVRFCSDTVHRAGASYRWFCSVQRD